MAAAAPMPTGIRSPISWSFSASRPAAPRSCRAPPAYHRPLPSTVAGTYVAQLIVNDGTVNSAPNSVTITSDNVAPVANAGPDQGGIAPGTLVTLNGSGSSDANGDPLTYSWSLSKPAGSAAVLSSTTSVSPTFTVDLAGTYVAQLIVQRWHREQRPRQRDHHHQQCRAGGQRRPRPRRQAPGNTRHPQWQRQLRCQRGSAHL